MKIFFDTEFTGLHKNTTLISIGLISEDGKYFYAELTDYDKDQCDEWIYKNVIANLSGESIINNDPDCYIGKKDEIANYLKDWFGQFNNIELVSDVCHYDMVLLIDLFGSAFDLPSNICPNCYDINQDIARFYHISLQKAFNMPREQIFNIPKYRQFNFSNKLNKHNSLYDACIIREIYKIVNNKTL